MRLEQFANPKGQGVPEALFLWGHEPGPVVCTAIPGFRYRQWLVRKSYLFRIRRRLSDGRAKPECPVMAMNAERLAAKT